MEVEIQGTSKSARLRRYWPVAASLLAGLAGLVMLWSESRVHEFPRFPESRIQILPLPVIGLAFAILALFKPPKKKTTRAGRVLAVSAITLNGLFVIGLVLQDWSARKEQLWRPIRRCSWNLHTLGVALEVYAAENGRYPAPDKWCDLLLGDLVPRKESFVCGQAQYRGDPGPCHYAINPHAEPNSPPNVVLVFETTGGWNGFGGPELLSDEHHSIKGCNILFNNMRIEFVRTKDLGELKWQVESGVWRGKVISLRQAERSTQKLKKKVAVPLEEATRQRIAALIEDLARERDRVPKGDGDTISVALQASWDLRKIGKPVISHLIDAAGTHRESDVRQSAVWMIYWLAERDEDRALLEYLPVFVRATYDRDTTVRQTAVGQIGAMTGMYHRRGQEKELLQLIPYLVKALEGNEELIRITAARHLFSIGKRELIPPELIEKEHLDETFF